jgi:hypothetical protein
MIANNIFRAIGDFCTNVLFYPYDYLRSINGWWASNAINSVIMVIGFVALFYWLGQMVKYKKASIQ